MDNSATSVKGKCHCGAITYQLSSEVDEVYCCNCKDCQVLSGSAFHLLGIVDREAIDIVAGDLKVYKNPTDSGFEMSRYFCPTCSAAIFIESTRFPEIGMVLVSTLDSPGSRVPAFEIWTKSKFCWLNDIPNLKRYACGAND